MRLLGTSRDLLECGHHWHVHAAGWRCCWCPVKVGREAAPPRSHTSLCLAPDEPADELLSWLQSMPPPDPRIVRQVGATPTPARRRPRVRT